MSSPPASNIVSFPSASADGTPSLSVTAAPDSLLGQIQTLWRDRMSAAVAGGLDKLIDEFYTEAEHALERDTRDF